MVGRRLTKYIYTYIYICKYGTELETSVGEVIRNNDYGSAGQGFNYVSAAHRLCALEEAVQSL